MRSVGQPAGHAEIREHDPAMPTQFQLDAWSAALRAPLVAMAIALVLLVALAIAIGVAPQALYADPSPLRFM
jgi:hypothetical protein